MKKVFMMMALLALPFAMQAQTKFHDVEANDATGAVKSIKSQMMGRDIIITFTEDGKMQREGMSDAKYDANGYLQSAKMSFQGQDITITYKWENGRIKSQTMNMMGQDVTTTRTYNEKGAPASESMNFGGQEMVNPYTDYQYDDHGNWISRKGSMMGREMTQTRTIEYYK
jgi:hypothetical protein